MQSILLTNDDGITAPGLSALYRELSSMADVHVVAPSLEQSGISHSITFQRPLTAHAVTIGDMQGHAISGTPADCVKLALDQLLPNPPDLVVSGINAGPNMGITLLYSGTVGAALEAVTLGVPSVAVSLGFGEHRDLADAARHAKRVIDEFAGLIGSGDMLNINIPALPPDEIHGWRMTSQGQSAFNEFYTKVQDPWCREYYWIDGKHHLPDEPESDAAALEDGYISVTPLGIDLTNYTLLERLKKEMGKEEE